MFEKLNVQGQKFIRHRFTGDWYRWELGYGWRLVWCAEMMN